jgi:hypothetical protein
MMLSLILSLLLPSSNPGNQAKNIPFTLRNSSLKSIYLEIPGVMNPNLSPMSNSGVSLDVGQKIYFFVKEQRYLLLEVDESLEGKKLSVNKLIRKRKKEIGLTELFPKPKGALPYYADMDQERRAEKLGKLVWLPYKPSA